MRKNNTAIIFGSLFFSCSVMAANGTLAPTVVPMVNGGQASIAISNTSPNLFTVPGDRIGAGNEVTVVFQDGFQLKTVEEMALERTQSRAEEDNPESPVPVPPSAESHLNGFNTDQMLKQLGNLNPQQFMSGSQGGGNDGK